MQGYVALWGAEGDDDGGETTTATDNSSTSELRTLTSEEIDKMVARAADRGSRKAVKTLASELGFENVGELKDFVSGRMEAEEAEEDEARKAAAAVDKAKADLAKEKADMAAERLRLSIEREVLRSGVTDEKRAARISTLVRADLDPTLDEEDWAESISDLLGEMKEDTPELFGKAASHGSGDGGTTGGSDTSDDSAAQQVKAWEQEMAQKGFVTIPADMP